MAANLICPIRGPLEADFFAKDGLTISEEARRIECIRYLLKKGYPKNQIKCETTIIKYIGTKGKNSLRADVVVFDKPLAFVNASNHEKMLKDIIIVGEIKRESKSKNSAVAHQLEPAMRQIDKPSLLGVYWDDINRLLIIKATKDNQVSFSQDSLGNLPEHGTLYKYKKLKYDDLIAPEDISATLMEIANVLRSNKINDDSTRYRETVKLLLAKYMDEREAKESGTNLILQCPPGAEDPTFRDRVDTLYRKTSSFYSKAKTIFSQSSSELDLKTLRSMVEKVQGLNLLESSTDSMQQVFMTFVPAVFKKELDQYFTPLTLINCMVEVLRPGINDKVVDPAMGTGDFLTATMQYRFRMQDGSIVSRVYGMDKDPQAYELAIINMILNKDGQTYLNEIDSIANPGIWEEEMGIAMCNPPFGARTVETDPLVLSQYDLGHQWVLDNGKWVQTGQLLESQQLGILFIERCFKLLVDGGKMGFILPEGYLCTASYGYVRQWILQKFRIIGLVELPRRIFLKSDADLRSNILFAIKEQGKSDDYPIHAELVRRVGYKLGKGFFPEALKDSNSGLEMRDASNKPIIATDFARVSNNFNSFMDMEKNGRLDEWRGARVSDILNHPQLDMKPRRLSYKALANIRSIAGGDYIRLGDIAEVVDKTVDLQKLFEPHELLHLIEGQDIRAVEGVVILKDAEKRWKAEQRKTNKVYTVTQGDIIIGLVRPERRNIGLFSHNECGNVFASPDGVAVVRSRPDCEDQYPIEWLFQSLRTEQCRIQFWTESGGTSYGKLTLEQIRNVLIPLPSQDKIEEIADNVRIWSETVAQATEKFHKIWDSCDKVAILNSPLIGLEADSLLVNLGTEEED
jgi:type I restriction enzyme M protein